MDVDKFLNSIINKQYSTEDLTLLKDLLECLNKCNWNDYYYLVFNEIKNCIQEGLIKKDSMNHFLIELSKTPDFSIKKSRPVRLTIK